jgi:hypothetical protein
MKAQGRAPTFLMPIAPPRVGFQPFLDYLSDIDAIAWRNGDFTHRDLVTEVPFTLPSFPFAQRPLTDISAPPPPNDEWGLLAWHHLELYISGIAAREAMAA